MLKDKKLEYESEWNENKENIIENEKKHEDEEISTTTADNENKSQAAEVVTLLKNIELFIKKKNYYHVNNPPTNTGLLENMMKDDEKATSSDNDANDENEILKHVIILTKEDLLEFEKQWDEEIFEDIRDLIYLIDSYQEYNYFSTSFMIYKHEDKSEKFNNWLRNENDILKKMNIDKNLKTENFKEKDVLKEILNFDTKSQRLLENHLRKIEEMKESLNNLSLNLINDKENFDIIKENNNLVTTFEKNSPLILSSKQEDNKQIYDKIPENTSKINNFSNESQKFNKPNGSNPIKTINNMEENKTRFEKTQHLEERLVSRSKFT